MSALFMLVRGRRSLANALPVIAFAAATAIVCTVLAGTGAFYGRLGPSGFEATDPSASPEAQITPLLVICAVFACVLLVPNAIALGGAAARLSLARREKTWLRFGSLGARARRWRGSRCPTSPGNQSWVR